MACKLVNKNGSLTIPQQLRHELGIRAGTALDMTALADGTLQLSRHLPACHVCGAAEEVKSVGGFTLCRACLARFGEEFENGATG